MTEEPTPGVARRRGRPPEAERSRRRDDIVDAAVTLFVAEGFEPVTLDRIAAAAHVAKRTIYTYIGDRTKVFLAAVERLRERALHDARPEEGLPGLAKDIVFALHSDDAVGLHRLAIGEARRFPDLAVRFYDDGPRRYIAALRDRLPRRGPVRAAARRTASPAAPRAASGTRPRASGRARGGSPPGAGPVGRLHRIGWNPHT